MSLYGKVRVGNDRAADAALNEDGIDNVKVGAVH